MTPPEKLPRTRGLNSEDAAIQESALGRYEDDPERFLSDYRQRFGNVLSADCAAELFPEYSQSQDARTNSRVAVHPAAQDIRDRLFERVLAEPDPNGANYVTFTAGGNGSGKASALTAVSDVPAQSQSVFDSTLSNYEHARKLIDAALSSGKRVTVGYVYRPLRTHSRAC